MNVKRWRMGCGCGVAEDEKGGYVEWEAFAQLQREHEVLKALCKEIETDYKTVFAEYRRLLVASEHPVTRLTLEEVKRQLELPFPRDNASVM